MNENKDIVYGGLLARISEAYLGEMTRQLSVHGLERFHVPLLTVCENCGKLTQKELGKRLRKDKVSVLRIVDYLSERGLVERKQNPDDRREQYLVSTAKGKALIPPIREAIRQTNDLFLKDFSEEEVQVFHKMVLKMMDLSASLPKSKYRFRIEKKED
ncbi:MarR family transcriptional regulator [Rapidithrix thailandica]|uniref:MarR family transcriptional regulator n=1 Tax=Rapidithrix thailandica TaxID=413964 RepID=A0AAW9S4V5_9BACT